MTFRKTNYYQKKIWNDCSNEGMWAAAWILEWVYMGKNMDDWESILKIMIMGVEKKPCSIGKVKFFTDHLSMFI